MDRERPSASRPRASWVPVTLLSSPDLSSTPPPSPPFSSLKLVQAGFLSFAVKSFFY